MSRITKAITYNIADRGRKYVGQDRSNVNIRSMIEQINSPATQELVASGDLFGYFGHEPRQLFGMNPPDTAVTSDGKVVHIVPAIRTVALSADNDGNVTHREEFLENDVGEYAYQQYKNKIGGFSTAVTFSPSRTGVRNVSGFHGFDYVRTPNYHTNRGDFCFDGLVLEDDGGFDSIEQLDPMQAQLKQALEQSLIAQYDGIYEVMQVQQNAQFFQDEAINAQAELDRIIMRKQRIAKREAELRQAQLDSLICPTIPFEESAFFDAIKAFDSLTLEEKATQTAKSSRNQEMMKQIQTHRQNKLTIGFQKLFGR